MIPRPAAAFASAQDQIAASSPRLMLADMKLGLGLYRHMLTPDNFRFAKQAGATHVVAHLVDYFRGESAKAADDQPTGAGRGWGLAGDPDTLWTLDELVQLRREVEGAGLVLEAIENFDPAHWHDVLLDGPKRDAQMDGLKTLIRRIGAAGIPIMGYNFSIAGVAGRTTGNYARGEAPSVGMEGPYDLPMPRGMAWNMIYDADSIDDQPERTASPAELWGRFERFIHELAPVAHEAGVTLAAHPDDPPLPTVRGQPRLVYQPQHYQTLIDLDPSPANKLEFCIGSLAEMTEGNVYEAIDHYSRQQRLAYVHFRNVRGKVPTYKETFVDDGDVDMVKVLRILKANHFEGVLIPDHTPQMTCSAPWHAGMAYALGYMKGLIAAAEARHD